MGRKSSYLEQMDKFIGRKIYFLRLAKGLSRAELSKVIDVTYQQLQKYENGTNRVSASRLLLIAKALEHEIPYFYEGFERSHHRTPGTAKKQLALNKSN